MKYLIYLLLLSLVSSSCIHAQQEEVEYHPIVLKAKETSLYTERVDWPEVNATFNTLIKEKEAAEDQKEALQYLINSLGDKHAVIRSPKDYAILVSYTGDRSADKDDREFDAVFHRTVINDVTAQFSYQLLNDGIGYLKVVGIGAGDVKMQADTIRNGLISLKAKGVSRWIVDLRFNGGGNIGPMISGLAPLIGEGFIGGSINARDEIRAYRIEHGQFFDYNRLVCPMSNEPSIDPTEKVAVLVSRYTVSSGEMLAIVFKGRKHTKFIGETSGGYTTGNGYSKINDDVALVISQGVFIDRNNTTYGKHVTVDENIEFKHQVDLAHDNQIDSAKTWLTN